MESFIWVVFCVLVLPLGFGLLIGWLMWGRRKGSAAPPVSPSEPLHAAWLAKELESDHLRAILSDEQRTRIREHYLLWAERKSTPFHAEELLVETSDALDRVPEGQLQAAATRIDVTPSSGETPDVVLPARAEVEAEPDVSSAPDSALAGPQRRSPVEPATKPGPMPAARDALDPAVLMLYLGAFLVVAAGIVYASYNWTDLGSWQKLGLLAGATVAFGATGWFLLANERVRQAAETFVAISALLVPANAVAAWTVFSDGEASTPVIVLLGSATTAIVYTVFSKRPGGWIYDYGAAIAGLLAVGSLLPAIGFHWGWSGPAVLLAVAASRELCDRIPAGWSHFRQPVRWTGTAALPMATGLGVVSILDDVTFWVVPLTFMTATVALASFARRSTNPVWGILTSLAGICAFTGIVAAIDPVEPWGWALPALATAVLLIVAGEYGPEWLRRPAVRLALHIEAVVGLFVAISIAYPDHPGLATGVVAAALLVSALIALVRTSRWWLLTTGAFATGLWFTFLLHVDAGDWNSAERLLFLTPLPVLLAVPAFRLDRVSEREDAPRWGEPLWLAAGLLAIGFTALPFTWATNGEDLPIRTLVVTCLVFGLAALVAAWSIDKPQVRIGYGLWTLLAAGLVVYDLDLSPTDALVAMLVMIGVLVAISAFGFRSGMPRPLARLSPRRTDQPRAEMPIHLVVAGLLFIAMVAAALRYISTVADELAWDDVPGIRWTWITYLVTFIVTTIATAAVGWRLDAAPVRKEPTDSSLRALPGLTIAQGLLAALLVLRMLTTDPIVWTWAGLALGVGLLALPLLAPLARSTNGFGIALMQDASWTGIALLALSTAANMSLTGDSETSAEYWTSGAIYLGVGIAVFAIGLKAACLPHTYIAFVALTLAAGQFARAVSDSDWAVILAFVILAWTVMGTAFALPTGGMWNGQTQIWTNAALGIGAFAVLVPGTNLIDVKDTDDARQVFVVALVSMAGLLAIDARLRQDRVRAIGGSALAMLALLIQISIREPENILWYAIPLGLYLLGLGVMMRKAPRQRDLLLGAGAGVLLVPTLILAQSEGDFGDLLLSGGFSIGLFLIGIALRLRVLIAAGVIGVTIIVLRMLIDAVLALESWITLLAVGLVLLGGGTASLVWKEALRERLDRLQAAWHDMG